MQLFDAVTLGDARITGDGYLVCDARIARTGIQIYAGREVGKPEMDKVRVYRPAEEVFHQDALASFAHKPVTIDHPSEAVSASNWKKYAVGLTGDIIAKDGGFVRVPMTLMDGAAIDTVKAGKRELSCGYTCDLKWEAGKTADGEEYDAIQTNIRGNHLAIVGAGRAGSGCRIGDDNNGKPTMQKITLDGITVEVSDTAAQVIAKVQQQLHDANSKILQMTADHATVLKAKDTELGAKDAEIEKLKGQVVTGDKLDALIAERSSVIDAARQIVGDSLDFKGKSPAEIRRATVAAKLGDAKVKDKSDDYVAALFDGMTGDDKVTTRDPVRSAYMSNDAKPNTVPTTDAAYSGMVSYLENAWQGTKQ